MPLMTMKID